MNKKLIKTIASITCGLGIVTSIPFAIASCENSSTNILPTKLLKINDDGVLEGFVSTFNPNNYKNKGYDTIKIPQSVTGISTYAFDYRYNPNACPTYITKIDFSGCTNLEYLSYCCFRDFASLTAVDFSGCSSLKNLKGEGYCFEGTSVSTLDFSETGFTKFDIDEDSNFNWFLYGAGSLTTLILPGALQNITASNILSATITKIIWNNLLSLPTLSSTAFANAGTTGSIGISGKRSTIASDALVQHLKTDGGLPRGWTAN